MADVTMSRQQLCYQVLDNLGVIAAGQTPNDVDVSKIDNLVDPTLADLAGRDIYYVDDPGQRGPVNGNIEPAAYLWLAHIITFQACPAYGLQGDPSYFTLSETSEGKLKTLSRPARTRRTSKIDPILYRGARRYGGTYNPQTGT